MVGVSGAQAPMLGGSGGGGGSGRGTVSLLGTSDSAAVMGGYFISTHRLQLLSGRLGLPHRRYPVILPAALRFPGDHTLACPTRVCSLHKPRSVAPSDPGTGPNWNVGAWLG